jgi:hypothetical protein
MHGLNNSPSVDHFGILCTPSHRNPCLLSLKLATENFKFDLHFPCTIRTTQFTLGKREQEFNCLASSTHSMRRNSTALYAGISWLKQRNNWNLFLILSGFEPAMQSHMQHIEESIKRSKYATA